jgi:hypothetical protein
MRRRTGLRAARRGSPLVVVLAIATSGLLAACASGSPSPSAAAVRLFPGSGGALRGAHTVWVAAAVSRSGSAATGSPDVPGAPASGAGGGASTAAGGSADVAAALQRALARVRRLELASTRERADLVLYFEQADRLRCWACRQPEGLWHWWGLVHDPTGRELASLHGETTAGADDAARRFAVELKKLLRHAGRGPREDATR